MTTLPTLAEFRRLRDAFALAHYNQRWPELCAEIARLEDETSPIFEAMRSHVEKWGFTDENKKRKYGLPHVYEKIYARMDGRDWTLQRLIAERDQMQKAIERLMDSVESEPEHEMELLTT